MCGICGTLGFGSRDLITRMANRITHRGPDSDGFIVDEEQSVFLANRRLSILDLDAGRQPFWTSDQQIGVVYNGEIYNEPVLREQLEQQGCTYRSHADTETIPYLFERHREAAFPLLNGMFAFALWDRHTHEVWLVRDPMGIKPLFVWDAPHGLAFASEIKCFLEIPEFRAEMNVDAVHLMLNVRFIPGPQTLFKGVRKVPPGHFIKWTRNGAQQHQYWQLPEVEPDITEKEAVEGFYSRLETAVERQIRSDVPLCVYLSGGIDSSLLVAALVRRGIKPATFCLGFNEPTDELADARRVAEFFGTEHHEAILESIKKPFTTSKSPK